MSRAIAIGDERRLGGYELAGAEVRHAPTADAVVAAWASLPADAALVVLTQDAYEALEPVLEERADVVWAVVPA